MDNNVTLNENINTVFQFIKESIDDDNILTEEEFIKIQELKEELNVTSQHIHDSKSNEIERILYLQLYLLLLDDQIDISERKEIEFYKKIFGYSENEIFTIKIKVRTEKQDWKDLKSNRNL